MAADYDAYWNRDYSKLIRLDSGLEFQADLAGMRAITEQIFNPDNIRDAVAEDINQDDTP